MLYPSSAYNAESDASTAYAVCATTEAVATKTVTIPGFVPFEGAMVNIFFIYANYMSETNPDYLTYHPTLKIISDPNDPSVYTDYPMLGMGNDIDSDIKGHLLGGSIYDTWASGAVVTFVFRSKINTALYPVIDPTPQGGWVMINAPQVLKHSVYRPGNEINLSYTYWPAYRYYSNHAEWIAIQFQFPYEISNGNIPFIPQVTGINFPDHDYHNPNDRPVFKFLTESGGDEDIVFSDLRTATLHFNYKLGMMCAVMGTGALGATSAIHRTGLAWFNSERFVFT